MARHLRINTPQQVPGSYGWQMAQDPNAAANARAAADWAYQQNMARAQARDAAVKSGRSAAPTVVPGTDAMTPAHDWTAFDKSFPNSPNSSAATRAPASIPAGSFGNAPSNIQGATVQGMLDRAQDQTNPGQVARATGQQQQTEYGTVGAGPNDWQATVIKNHPEIGMAGTQANADFVDAWKKASAVQGPGLPPPDPHQIAQNVMDNIRNPTKPMDTPPGMAAAQTAMDQGYKAPTPINGPQAQVTMGGALAGGGATDWTPVPDTSNPATSARIAGEAARSRISDVMNQPDSPMSIAKGAWNAVTGAGNAVGNAWDSAKGYVGGLLGPSASRSSASAPTTSTPSASFPLTQPQPSGFALGPDLANNSWMPGGDETAKNTPNFAEGYYPGQPGYSDPFDVAGVNPASNVGMGDMNMIAQANHNIGNYARGILPVKKAVKREKRAIAKGVGGAQPGDQPEVAQLPGIGQAVINTGEQVVPSMAGGFPAVLNRNQQRRMPMNRQFSY